ncbi:dedicator of cytokinesis protein 3-like [Clytia hemisphaerica]|uniref:Dedicator of cytokinesis protein 3 n=1 Tax=Clytia hemisphaerica TaxID=252671 RepID=A0A7M6DIV9_9CNID
MVMGDKWKATDHGCKYGVALCNFTPSESLQHGLKLNVGETVQIQEEYQGWFKGKLMQDRSITGIFPKNHVKVKEANLVNFGKFEEVIPTLEPVIEESTSVLREWGSLSKDLFLERSLSIFQVLKATMNTLMENRREIIFGKLTQDQQKELKEKITDKIDSVNKKLNLDLVPRIDGEIIEGDSASVVELYQVHLESSKRISRSKAKSKRNSSASGQHNQEKRMSIYGTLSKRPPPLKTPTSHHFFIAFKSFICNIGEAATLLFGLYDKSTGKYLSEKFVVKLTKLGMPEEIELLGKQFGIFQDLTNGDLTRGIYLICKIFREGKLIDSSKKHANAEYRRPFGGGVMDVSNILLSDLEDEKELYIPMFAANNEQDFHLLEDLIIRKQTNKYSSFGSNANFSVCIDVKLFHGDVEKVLKEKSGGALTQRLGFPEVILPGYVRNDFYVTLSKADLEKGSKSAGKNIEVALCVVSDKGQIFNDCMSIGSGGKPMSEYRSYVLYHTNSPHWNERIKVCLPIEQFHKAHLRFTFSHCSRNEGKVKGERIFGFSFIKLLKADGTVTRDGPYELFIYKFDNSVDFMKVQSYLRLPANKDELAVMESKGVVFAGPARNPKECLSIRTYLCSTRLTQNTDIINFFQWRNLEEKDVVQALDAFLKVSPEEIVKFLQDVFDALFKILSELQGDIGFKVFEAVVSITKIVEEPKYNPFKSTLNSYIDEHFSAALAYRSLANNLCLMLQHHHKQKNRTNLAYAVKSLTYIFKMIIRSYQLNFSATQNIVVLMEVKELLDQIFNCMVKLVAAPGDALNEIKGDLLKKLPEICDDALAVLSAQEYSAHVTNILGAVQKSSNAYVHAQRLQCLRNIVESKLFVQKDSRIVIMHVIVDLLAQFMERKQELALCLELLGEVTTALQHLDSVTEDVSLLANKVLGIELNVLLTIDRRGPTTGLSVACLLGILKLMDSDQRPLYKEYMEVYGDKHDLRDFLKKLIVAFKELLTIDTFPKDWFVLRTVGNNVILTAVQYFSKAFTDYFLQHEYFDQTLWESYFQLAVLFLTQPALQSEQFQQAKRTKTLEKYGDMRRVMGFEILNMWEILGPRKKFFIPTLIGPFLEMTLVPDLDLRRATIPIFYDMMKVEYHENHDFKKVESELMEQLERLMKDNKGDLEYEELFTDIMTNKFREGTEPHFHDEGIKSIRSISELLRRLLDYRGTSNNDSNNDVKMMCTYNLLEFYEQYSRQDMYIKCIHELADLHVTCDNFTEAGCTLKLHAALLDWVDNELPKFLDYPSQLEWQRKEKLYLQIIEYFDKGKTWESGIQLCKELTELYENKILDYTKLSEILRKQAYFYDNIMKQIRPAHNYFRVSFYGRAFPHYLKDEVLVYRGLEFETLAGFTSRIRVEFPNAEILYKNTPPDPSIVQGISQHIQICNVNPIPGEIDIIQADGIDEKITSYYRTNEVSEFIFNRPFHKGDKDPANEFKTLWMERTVHWTKRTFPNILKWSRIDSTRKTELTPIENAMEMILTKNKELEAKVTEYSSGKETNINPLSMILNGIIDANVNGGIANYQTAFLSEEYMFLNPEDKDKINHLKTLLHDQSRILSQGLQVHETYVTDALRPFHDRMVMMYSAMKISIETGQSMESILARPNSLQVGSISVASTRSGGSPGKGNSPRESPAESRRLINFGKSPSDGEIAPKKDKKSISASLQSILRRTSAIPDHEKKSPHGSHENLRPSPLAAGPPPIPSRPGDSDGTSSPMSSPAPSPAGVPSDLSSAAMRRLGLQPNPNLAASAPSLVSIEEEKPSLPPKNKLNKRHTASGEVYNTSFESVFRPIDLENTKPISSRHATSSPQIPQISSPTSPTNSSKGSRDERDLLEALNDMQEGYNEGNDIYDRIANQPVEEIKPDFYEHSDPPPPVPEPRKRISVEESVLPPPLPPSRPRGSSQRNGGENLIDSDVGAPPPLPKKSAKRQMSMDTS